MLLRQVGSLHALPRRTLACMHAQRREVYTRAITHVHFYHCPNTHTHTHTRAFTPGEYTRRFRGAFDNEIRGFLEAAANETPFRVTEEDGACVCVWLVCVERPLE
jgi:hypothetical protein